MAMLADVAGGNLDFLGEFFLYSLVIILGWLLALWATIIGCFGRKPVRIFRIYLCAVASASLGINLWLVYVIDAKFKLKYLWWPGLAILVTLCSVVIFFRVTKAA